MHRSSAVLAALGAALVSACSSDCNRGATVSSGESDASTGLAASSTAVAEQPDAPMNATPLPSAAVDAVLNPNKLPVYDGPTASLEGTVTVIGDPAPVTPGQDFSKCPAARGVYERAFREGPPLPDGSRPLADALVVVTGYAGYIVPERHPARTLTAKDCAYSSRTVDMTFGQILEISNLEEAGGKMYAPELTGVEMPALMVAPPKGDPVRIYPRKPGFFELKDRMGPPFMTAAVYALLQPLHAVTDANGHYRIDGIPVKTRDGAPVGPLDLNVRERAINRDVTKPFTASTGGVVEKVDVQLEYHAPDAGAAPAPASASASAHGGKAKAPDLR